MSEPNDGETFADEEELLDLANECRKLRRAYSDDEELDFQAMKLTTAIANYLSERDQARRATIERYITGVIGWLAEWKKSKGLI